MRRAYMAPVSAVVVILNKRDEVLILQRPHWIDWAPDKWALPGGSIEENESPLTAAIRETKEETTLDVRKLKIINLTLDNPIAPYYTRYYTGNVQIDFEHTDWTWVARADIETYDLAPGVLKLYDWVLQNG
jgi:8-oxo-dGTP pyrophosphatase MutT (NUDIX family)|tara:strand:+ start:281 stop:673 length:393 start_codon:yes stop_codon:yes gene_type:complete